VQLFAGNGVLVPNEYTPVRHPSTGSRSDEFTTFMRAYQDMVFSTAARLAGDRGRAEDIAQEVFLRAYEHFTQLRGSPTAGGWLKTVTTNLTLNYLTRYRKRWRFFSEASGPELEVPQPDTLAADLGKAEQRLLIEEALRQLPDHQRLALVLYHYEELSYEEIAGKLHASLAKIKTDIRRARAALLPILQASGIGAAGAGE
jgi:RNA polymerase sigma-70 factor (ECF subfamily)